MPSEITPITTRFMLHITVNCYLVQTGDGFVLIDTGTSAQRDTLDRAITQAGCRAGDLKLIVLTHGDFDHCGNAAYFRAKYHAPIALHDADRGMVERGNMFWNRKQPNAVVKFLSGRLFKLAEADRFTPDVMLAEGDSLTEYGFDTRVIHLPGHSLGNIGLLTADGDLFCGDLLGNLKKPEVWSIMDDPVAMAASVEKVRALPVTTIYPGHGKPFSLAELA